MSKPTKQQWLDFIEEQTQSDQSVPAFCQSKNISVDNFYYHRGRQRKNTSINASPFVRAQLNDNSLPIKNQADLILSVGRSQLQLPVNISPQWLATLIASLA